MSHLRLDSLQFRHWGPFSFTLAPGECVGLSGPSGAGKTLLLRAIADLDVHSGKIFLDDAECSQVHAPAWRRQVGLLLAESQWWHDTVVEHLPEIDEAALKQLGLTPEVLKWPVSRLSSGEKQRLAVIRLLGNRPKVLLLDEPTANLDDDNTARVESLIEEYRQSAGAPTFWACHDKEQLRRVAVRQFRLEDGSLREFIPDQ